jgi:FkbM family methyltransferase
MDKIKRIFNFIFNHPLSKKHPYKSIYRFIIWQLQSRFLPARFYVKYYLQDVKFYARKGLAGITGNIYSGLHEFNDMAFLLHFLRHEDVFFDIGANVGSYTLLASGIIKAKSIAIEPIASTFYILKKNIELNKLNNVASIINAGAGGQEGVLTFSSDEGAGNHVISIRDVNKNNTIQVSVITIDSLLDTLKPALIKIDVEGYETEVLKGMIETLALSSLKAIIIELNGSGARYGYNEDDIHRLLLQNNFNPYSYDPFKRLLKGLEQFGDFNTIYCRDIAFINNRVNNAPFIKIMGENI